MSSRWEEWAKLPHHHHLVKKRRHGDSLDCTPHLAALNLEDFSEIREQSLDLPFVNPDEYITASSCGGFIYLVNHRGTIFLFNPTTQIVRLFPRVEDRRFVGGSLGYDSKSDDYKIVRVHRRGAVMYAEVYSLKNGNNWKAINPPPNNRSPRGHGNIYIAATGRSYWLGKGSGCREVISFDFSSETFSLFPLPSPPYVFCLTYHLLVKLHDGLLGVVCYWRRDSPPRGFYLELWVWSEGDEEWDMMYDVCLCGRLSNGCPLGLVEGRFLLLMGESEHLRACRLLVYDWITKECREVPGMEMDGTSCFVPSVVSYVETADVLPSGVLIQNFVSSVSRIDGDGDGNGDHGDGNGDGDGDWDGDGDGDEYFEKIRKLEEEEEYVDWRDNGFRVVEDDASKVRCVIVEDDAAKARGVIDEATVSEEMRFLLEEYADEIQKWKEEDQYVDVDWMETGEIEKISDVVDEGAVMSRREKFSEDDGMNVL